MTHHLYIAHTLAKQLQTLYRTGSEGELVRTRCENLLDKIQREGLLAKEVYMKRTKNGEYRISKCIKYDLGNGYRLVTIKVRKNLFVPFVGSHDETDLWLEHHKYDDYSVDDPTFIKWDTSGNQQTQTEEPDKSDSEDLAIQDLYEEQLQARIDEKLLKTVFHGLFQKHP